ncbi:uncharacterized protein B0T15DRAFT_424431 [Chaetomium strumarium]|uniref:Zn(2)-C6 fungal-type domain-containing protein n=1 Tax=Chaetomium strumarium TaxID=1170767 RepID=A0AAJ0H560_9PEZI|nr:hypothetical protein B0T15DRAFT_424431 [Chaetomium strumarium]
MPASSGVPPAYTSRWKVNSLQTSGRSRHADISNRTVTPQPAICKYNTSCNACRKARVKCSRGNPCRRCATAAEPESCVYSISRRRGKRKASDGPQADVGPEVHLEEAISVPVDAPDTPNIAAGDPMTVLLQGWSKEPLFPLPSESMINVVDFANPIDMFPSTGATTAPISTTIMVASEGEKCPDACYASVHAACNKLISTLNQRGSAGLDVCMTVLDSASEHACKYLACVLCDTGCTRLMTLALLHQRQLNLLCDICANPSLYLWDNDMRVSLGSYRPPNRERDVAVKRAMLLGVASGVRERVEVIRDRLEEFEDRIERGVLELAEAGRLNLQWLLAITGNLVRRLDTIKALLAREDWGLNTGAIGTR